MLRSLRFAIPGLALIFTFSAIPYSAAQTKAGDTVEKAPVPVQISAAKKVFISNGGLDSNSLETFQRMGDPDRTYSQFYAAMKSWGRFELTATPADADLVLEIRFTAPLVSCDKICTYAPQIGLIVLDAKTHFTLWALVEPVDGAFRKATWEKNFREGMTKLVDDLKKLPDQH